MQPPSIYLEKYLPVLLILNIVYMLLFWMLGLYDRRSKRALLEEFLTIFGVISTGIAIFISILFVNRMFWMSRAVLFLFWGGSVTLLCLSRLLWPLKLVQDSIKFDINELKSRMKGATKNFNQKDLSIIVVTYNSLDKLKESVRSLKEAGYDKQAQLLYVDNASSDTSVEYVKGQLPQAKIIKNNQNMGYSAAINSGLKIAQTPYCLILNPDVEVVPGSIEFMIDFMKKNQRVGLAGSRLLNPDGTLQYSARRFLDLRTYLYRFTPLRGLMKGSALERYYLMQDWDHRQNRIVDWVLGGCMLVRKEALNAVGLMDEKFFLYFEDVDWCFRMWEKGWQIAYVAEAAMIHKHMRTSVNRLFNRATYVHFLSLFYFLRKHGLHFPQNCPSSRE